MIHRLVHREANGECVLEDAENMIGDKSLLSLGGLSYTSIHRTLSINVPYNNILPGFERAREGSEGAPTSVGWRRCHRLTEINIQKRKICKCREAERRGRRYMS